MNASIWLPAPNVAASTGFACEAEYAAREGGRSRRPAAAREAAARRRGHTLATESFAHALVDDLAVHVLTGEPGHGGLHHSPEILR